MNPVVENPNGLSLTQKILIGIAVGAVIGAVSVVVQNYASNHFVKRNAVSAGKRTEIKS